MNQVELCRSLAAVDSSTSHGTKDIVKFVAEIAQEWKLAVEIQEENYNGIPNANIIIRKSNTRASRELLLISRLDTLDPGDYAYWVRTGANPFNVSLDGENMYGLGLTEAKADFASKLMALKEIKKSEFKNISPVVVGTFGHASGAGAIRLIRRKNVNPVAALVGGPTALRLANKGPGYAKVEISIPFSEEETKYHEKHNSIEASISQSKIFSRATASGRADVLSENPILRMIEYLKNLPQGISIISVEGGASSDAEPDTAALEIDIVDTIRDGVLIKLVRIGEALKALAAELKTVCDKDCEPNYSTITIGAIRTFPEEIKIYGTCRLVPVSGRDIYEAWLERLRHECAGIGASFRILDYKPPFQTLSEGSFFDILKGVSSEAGLNSTMIAAQNCTEANIFHRLGIDSVVFGPGEVLRGTHASQEHVKVADLVATEVFYRKIIERFCI